MTPTQKRRSPVVPLVVALVAALALGLSLVAGFAGGDADEAGPGSGGGAEEEAWAPDQAAPPPPEAYEPLSRRDPDDPMALGDPDAPVVMLAYSEFQCPFCGRFARETEPDLVEKYVEDGTLRIEWRDFPYLGQESTLAARAGRAAAAQDTFWEFHDALYAEERTPNTGSITRDYLTGLADDLGLDVEQFTTDMDAPEAQEAIDADMQQGTSIGVTGTPAFVINGLPVIGAQPLEAFEVTIEQALANLEDAPRQDR